jgi:5,10-methylene-tetrahydrofolate dehydrogenase/methenyl tetrahydrofolate cyclohydrolase
MSRVGFESTLVKLPSTSETELLKKIKELNEDDNRWLYSPITAGTN